MASVQPVIITPDLARLQTFYERLRDILADLPDDAVVIVARDGAGGDDCSPLADVEEGWYFPVAGESAPLGRDVDGNVHEPGPRDLYAVLLRPAPSPGWY